MAEQPVKAAPGALRMSRPDGKTDGNHARHTALQEDTQEQRKRTRQGEKGPGRAGGSRERAGKQGKKGHAVLQCVRVVCFLSIQIY